MVFLVCLTRIVLFFCDCWPKVSQFSLHIFYLNASAPASKNGSQDTRGLKKCKDVFHMVFPIKAVAQGWIFMARPVCLGGSSLHFNHQWICVSQTWLAQGNRKIWGYAQRNSWWCLHTTLKYLRRTSKKSEFKEELLCWKDYLVDLIKDVSPCKSHLSFILTFPRLHQHNCNLHMNGIMKIYELNPRLKNQFCS